MKLLIVEDEYRIARLIADWFASKGIQADIVSDGRSGYKAAMDGQAGYDLMILDVMLPQMDGFEVLRRLRAEGCHLPVLMLTARTELEDRLAGFDAGAQDYLAKPFDLRELEARVSVLTQKGVAGRAGSAVKKDELTYKNLILNMNEHTLKSGSDGREVRLPQKEYSLMEYFMKNPNQILSKEQITVRIWGYDCDASYNHEEVYISFLRKKMKFLKSEAAIVTIRGAGYALRGKDEQTK